MRQGVSWRERKAAQEAEEAKAGWEGPLCQVTLELRPERRGRGVSQVGMRKNLPEQEHSTREGLEAQAHSVSRAAAGASGME